MLRRATTASWWSECSTTWAARVSGSFGPSLDEGVYIPISTSRTWFGDRTMKTHRGHLRGQARGAGRDHCPRQGARGRSSTRRASSARCSEESHKQKDWVDKVPLELLRSRRRKQQRIWSIVLASIAGISLLVGGIGIMNVMLATVTERTREIGIRRALGAKKRHIVSQFLVETLVLSCCGGMLGVALGHGDPRDWSSTSPR